MKLYYFNSDGWTTSEYTNRNGSTPKNVHIIPDNIPANLAFFDGSGVIAKTQAEHDSYKQNQVLADKLAQTVFEQMDILKAFDDLGKKTELLNLLSTNTEFATYWAASKTGIDLEHDVCVQAIASLELTPEQINAVKLAILGE